MLIPPNRLAARPTDARPNSNGGATVGRVRVGVFPFIQRVKPFLPPVLARPGRGLMTPHPPDGPLQRFFFFFNDTATTEIYTLSLHDALPICSDPIADASLPEI